LPEKKRRNEAIGAPRSGFFGVPKSCGRGAGNGLLAPDLAEHRLLSAAAIVPTGKRANRFGDLAALHPGLPIVRCTKSP
jgi:hypothetical protein